MIIGNKSVSASSVFIDYNKTLKVTVSSKHGWQLCVSGQTTGLDYTLTKTDAESELENDDPVLEVQSGSQSGSQALVAELTGTVTRSGDYSDVLTFTVKVE